MCGRYTLHSQPDAISAAFGVPEFSQTRLRFNIAPSQIVAAVRQSHGNHTRELVMLEWGQGHDHRLPARQCPHAAHPRPHAGHRAAGEVPAVARPRGAFIGGLGPLFVPYDTGEL